MFLKRIPKSYLTWENMDKKLIHDIVNLLTIASGMAKKSLESVEKVQSSDLTDAKDKLQKTINAITRLENLISEVRSKNQNQNQVQKNETQLNNDEQKLVDTNTDRTSEKSTVLIVDDEIDILDLLKEELSSLNLNIVSANDGRQGFAQFIQHKPDLVISDVNMPHLNGLEMTQLMFNKSQDVKFILLGGDLDENSISKLPHAKSITFMSKPFDFENLNKYIKDYLKVG